MGNRLADRAAIVTGAAQGIGAAYARALAADDQNSFVPLCHLPHRSVPTNELSRRDLNF